MECHQQLVHTKGPLLLTLTAVSTEKRSAGRVTAEEGTLLSCSC